MTVQALGTFDAAPDPWYTYAGFSPGAPMVILPEGYRPDVWLGPLAGISTDMAGNVKSEAAFLFPDGRLMFPSLADGGIYEYFAVMFSFRAA